MASRTHLKLTLVLTWQLQEIWSRFFSKTQLENARERLFVPCKSRLQLDNRRTQRLQLKLPIDPSCFSCNLKEEERGKKGARHRLSLMPALAQSWWSWRRSFFFLSFSGRKGWARISGCWRRLRGWWFHRRYWRKGCRWASWKESELLFVMQFARNGGEEAPYKEASSVYIILRKICCVTCVTVSKFCLEVSWIFNWADWPAFFFSHWSKTL